MGSAWLHEIDALWGLDPVVLLAYSTWALTNSKRQLPHDQLAGTVVVRQIAAPVSQQTLDKVRAHYGDPIVGAGSFYQTLAAPAGLNGDRPVSLDEQHHQGDWSASPRGMRTRGRAHGPA